MKPENFINNISSLQIYQLLRFSTFLLISILFTKSHLSTADIGMYEVFLFIASIICFFWVTGLIQSLLPLYNNNRSFNKTGGEVKGKSPEIFNAFLLITFFSLLTLLLGLSLRGHFSVFGISGDVPFINLLLAYIFLSSPTFLIEYIYLLNNKAHHILGYGSISFSIQLVIVTVPIFTGYEIAYAIWGLIIISILRFIWLFVLLSRYAEFRFSWDFIKEHISLGFPLIISTLLSGSAQYVDGIIVTSKYDAEVFAKFRFGAKELPLVLLLANGLSNAMLSEFGSKEKLISSLKVLRHKSRRLMHYLFPITMVFMLFTRVLYPVLFNENFIRSADIFLIYLLLIIPRLVFPQTILIGLKKTRIILIASFIEIVLNVCLSLYMVQLYGLVGIALATVVVYIVEKGFLIAYNYFKLHIKPNEYIPVTTHLIYSFLTAILFVLIDHRIIDIYY